MQQYLPFTVLKHTCQDRCITVCRLVATVPTVYGIETAGLDFDGDKVGLVATVPTVYGIETLHQ